MPLPPRPRPSHGWEVTALRRAGPWGGGPGAPVFQPGWGQLLWGHSGLRRERAGRGAWPRRGCLGSRLRGEDLLSSRGHGWEGPALQGRWRGAGMPSARRRARDAGPLCRLKPRASRPPEGRAYLASVLTLPEAFGGVPAEDLACACRRRCAGPGWGSGAAGWASWPGGSVTVGEVTGVVLQGRVLGVQPFRWGTSWDQEGEGPRPGSPGHRQGSLGAESPSGVSVGAICPKVKTRGHRGPRQLASPRAPKTLPQTRDPHHPGVGPLLSL